MQDQKWLTKIGQLLNQLSVPLAVRNTDGKCLIPPEGEDIAMTRVLPAGANVKQHGFLLRQLDINPPLILSIPEKTPGAKDILCLAERLISSVIAENGDYSGTLEFYRRVLRRDMTGAEMNDTAQEMGITLDGQYCALVFRFDSKQPAMELLGEVIPLSREDKLVPISHNQTVLIKDMANMDGLDELIQFAQAVEETLREEIGLEALIGIGDEKTGLQQLYVSYQEALRAIEVGRVFRPSDKIYPYRHLMLERLLMLLPKEDGAQLSRTLFQENTAKLFTPDILHTIDVFFEKDLNLSDTARILFVHRNTLVYRLDKIQKVTGLDLRRFNDAAAFKALYGIHKMIEETTK